jgi:hypothetical protein
MRRKRVAHGLDLVQRPLRQKIRGQIRLGAQREELGPPPRGGACGENDVAGRRILADEDLVGVEAELFRQADGLAVAIVEYPGSAHDGFIQVCTFLLLYTQGPSTAEPEID